jgi:hypothetical protein
MRCHVGGPLAPGVRAARRSAPTGLHFQPCPKRHALRLPRRAPGPESDERRPGSGRRSGWRAWQESNLRPLASEANALSN